jgi:hypothetical protein
VTPDGATERCVIAVCEAALLPQSFPNPHSVRGLDGKRETELMRQHTDLPAMMGVVDNHECQHGPACGPWSGPSIPAKTFHATAGPRESLHKHLGEGSPSLLLRAGGPIKRGRER